MLRFTLNNAIEGIFICPREPKGWDTGTLSLIRSPLFHGVNYTRTLSLQFLCNSGKEYIDNIYETQGIDAEITVLVEDSCDCIPSSTDGDYNEDYNEDYDIEGSTIDCDWEEFFRGILNLKEYNRTEQITDVSIIEQSLNQKFTSRIETKIKLFETGTVDGEDFDNIVTQSDVTLHSKALTYVAYFGIINANDGTTFDPVSDTLYFEIPLYVDSYEGYTGLRDPSTPFIHRFDDVNTGGFEQIYQNDTSFVETITVEIDVIGNMRVNGNGNFPSTATRSTSLQLRVGSTYLSATQYNIVAPFNWVYNASGYVTVPLTSSLTQVVTLNPGDFIFISFVVANIPTDSGNPQPWFALSDFSKFEVKFKSLSVTDPSPAKGTLIYEAFARVLQGILSVEDPVRSTYYGRQEATPYSEPINGDGCFTMVMDGFRIRQYPLTGDAARTPAFSFKQLFDTFNTLDDIGFGFEKLGSGYVGRLERKKYFYSGNKSLTLLKVPNVKVSVAQDFYYNNIELGFNKWQNNGINGLDEYCSQSQYTNGLKSIDNTLEKISPGIASGYLLEGIRRMPYSTFLTEDTDTDSDLYIVALNRHKDFETGVPDMLDVTEKDENFDVITNVLHPPSVYNLRWTVVRNLIRNVPSIAPALVKNPGRFIQFQAGEANYKTITREADGAQGYFNGYPLDGQQDIQWDDPNLDVFEPPLYVPEFIEFSYPLKKSEFQILQNQPYDYIEVNTGKEIHQGYIIEANYKPKSGLTAFKLIRRWQ